MKFKPHSNVKKNFVEKKMLLCYWLVDSGELTLSFDWSVGILWQKKKTYLDDSSFQLFLFDISIYNYRCELKSKI